VRAALLALLPLLAAALGCGGCTGHRRGDSASEETAPPARAEPPPVANPAPSPALETRAWKFDDLAAGAVPAGFAPAAGTWAAVADATGPSPGMALEQSQAVDPWAVLLAGEAAGTPRDFRVRVSFKPVRGLEDASDGILFRARGPADGYLVRANAMEDNFRLYVIGGGRRWQLATAQVEPPPLGTWHVIEVEAQGRVLRAALDGKWLLRAEDDTYAEGAIGLWTKADSVTRFDDLVVERLK